MISGKKPNKDEQEEVLVINLSVETDWESCVVNTVLNDELPDEMITIALEALLEDLMEEEKYRRCVMAAVRMHNDIKDAGIESTRQKRVMS